MIDQCLKDFDVVAMADLAELTTSPGAALQFFQSAYREQYHDQNRIVVYTDQAVPDDLLKHFYQTTNFLDISNWFVVFCTPTDIHQQLADVCKSVSQDPVPFQNIVVSVTGKLLQTQYTLPSSMCAIPWSNINIKANGDITPCCMYNGVFGNIQQQSINDVFYGHDMQQLRQQFLDGKRPTGCSKCWIEEDHGLTSGRQLNQSRLRKDFLTQYLNDPRIANLDIVFQNTCNFKCRICNPNSSSLIAEEHHRVFKIPLKPQLKWSESDEFIQQVDDLLPQLTNIDMYGGEPFLIRKFARVLKRAIETNTAKNIRLHYNSNGSIWPKELVDLWPYFKEVDIHFSIDAIGRQFEYQRGGTWHDVEANILRIKNLKIPSLKIRIMLSISILNVLYIDQVLEWAERYELPVYSNHVTWPEEFSLLNLTPLAKSMILEKHKNNNWPEMQKILDLVQSASSSNGKSFCDRIAQIDQVRGENFAKDHLEIANAMGYVYNNNC